MSTSSPSKSEKKRIRETLNNILIPIKPSLHLALAIGYLQTVFFIAQSWFLATVFSRLLIASANHSAAQSIFFYGIAFLVLYGARAYLDSAKDQLLQKASLTVRADLRQTLIAKLSILGPERRFYGSDGALSTQIIDQVDALDGYLRHFYVQQRIAAITPLLIAIAAAFYSPISAFLMLSTAPLVPIFMIFAGIAAADKNRKQLTSLATLSGRFLDMLRGLATLKHLGADNQAQKIIEISADNYRKKTMGVLALAFLSTAVLELLSSLAIAMVAVYLGLGLLGILPWELGVIPVAYQGALFILLMAPEFYAPLRKLGADYHDKAKAEAAVSILNPLLDVVAPENASQTIVLTSAPAITAKALQIMSQSRIRLSSVSLAIEAGERVNIKGPSGIGKSSLLQALLGFIHYQGSISINQAEVSSLEPANLRAQVAYLSQNPAIIAGSIAENLRLAKVDASDDELWDVLDQVGLKTFVKKLSNGLNLPLGERGAGLSGGQLQRLSIAQLLLRRANLWLLDEPTAHLDPQTANDILLLLETVSRGKTLLIISHQEHISWVNRQITLGAENEGN